VKPANKKGWDFYGEGSKIFKVVGAGKMENVSTLHCILQYGEQEMKCMWSKNLRPLQSPRNLTLSVLSSPALTILQLSV